GSCWISPVIGSTNTRGDAANSHSFVPALCPNAGIVIVMKKQNEIITPLVFMAAYSCFSSYLFTPERDGRLPEVNTVFTPSASTARVSRPSNHSELLSSVMNFSRIYSTSRRAVESAVGAIWCAFQLKAARAADRIFG